MMKPFSLERINTVAAYQIVRNEQDGFLLTTRKHCLLRYLLLLLMRKG